MFFNLTCLRSLLYMILLVSFSANEKNTFGCARLLATRVVCLFFFLCCLALGSVHRFECFAFPIGSPASTMTLSSGPSHGGAMS